MNFNRQFRRYDVSLSGVVRGYILGCEDQLKLFTIGQGGCAFLGSSTSVQMVPPMKLHCTFDFFEAGFRVMSKALVGELIYVRPFNTTQQMMFGVSFERNLYIEMEPFANRLERLAAGGEVDRA